MAVFAALLDGTLIAPANHGKTALRALRALARAQRRLARKPTGSNNRRKQARRVARLHARVSAARRAVLHKLSTILANNHGMVGLDKLDVRTMVRSASGTVAPPGRTVRAKSGLNRSILDQGWGAFRTMLGWTLAERGDRLVDVPAHNTRRTGAACGAVAGDSRQDQRFRCVACGHAAHADTHAAINILRRAGSPVLPVEATGGRAGEAGPIRRTA